MKATSFVIGVVLLVLIIGYFVFYYFSMSKVKTPEYSVLQRSGNIEIRQYKPMLIAEVEVTGKRRPAIRKGFRLLANYIFGNNHITKSGSQKIAMTAPVIQQPAEKIAMTAPVIQEAVAKQLWKVQFVMPRQYSMETIPKPNNKQIKLIVVPAQSVVVIRFSGRITTKNIEEHLKILNQYIKINKLQVVSLPQYAFYNPPWTLPFMRRNEVMYKIKP